MEDFYFVSYYFARLQKYFLKRYCVNHFLNTVIKYHNQGLFRAYGSMTIAAGNLTASRQLRAQIWNRKQKAEKPTPSGILLPAKPHLLILPK